MFHQIFELFTNGIPSLQNYDRYIKTVHYLILQRLVIKRSEQTAGFDERHGN